MSKANYILFSTVILLGVISCVKPIEKVQAAYLSEYSEELSINQAITYYFDDCEWEEVREQKGENQCVVVARVEKEFEDWEAYGFPALDARARFSFIYLIDTETVLPYQAEIGVRSDQFEEILSNDSIWQNFRLSHPVNVLYNELKEMRNDPYYRLSYYRQYGTDTGTLTLAHPVNRLRDELGMAYGTTDSDFGRGDWLSYSPDMDWLLEMVYNRDDFEIYLADFLDAESVDDLIAAYLE